MHSIRRRLRHGADCDRGMTLIEVMVAMFVFAIMSTLVLSSLLQIVTNSKHSRSQRVATNLAASAIDQARDVDDVFELLDDSWSTDVDGTTFRVQRETEWVSDDSSDVACGAGGGNLRFKRVNITVTWAGMRPGSTPVRSDTLINPAERINDPSKGTVMVFIYDAEGAGVDAAVVSLRATSGGSTAAPITTNPEGCAYFRSIPGGTYEVTVAKSGYIGILEATPRESDVSVQAGSSTSVALQYDRQARLRLSLADGSSARMPRGAWTVTLVGNHGVRTVDFSGNSATRDVLVHPRVNYRVFAGTFRSASGGSCEATDPAAWLEDLDRSLAPGAASQISTEPGGSAALGVPMGLVRVPSGASRVQVTAVEGRPGDPACDTPMTFTYDVSGGAVVALPYGTWSFTNANNGRDFAVTPLGLFDERLEPHVVTLDPRQAAS